MICTSFPFCSTLALSPTRVLKKRVSVGDCERFLREGFILACHCLSSSATGLSSISLNPRRSIAKGQGRKRNYVYETKRAEQYLRKRFWELSSLLTLNRHTPPFRTIEEVIFCVQRRAVENRLDKREGTVILRGTVDVVMLRCRRSEGDLQSLELRGLRREEQARLTGSLAVSKLILVDSARK